ncbi:MAG TPA: RagB/SusD family nutrient uptake outer membrane protein [Puia sp.]|jgi:hypothetical protein|nr:RagB/SusD family nutrient uptake outer membrane protein [Puia sp.]
MKFNCNLFYLGIIFLLGTISCKKFVQINPPTTEITATTVFSNNASAAAAMSGIYGNMMSNGTTNLSSGVGSVSLQEGLAADELTDYSSSNPTLTQFYVDALTSASSGSSNSYYWPEIFNEIYAANAVIEGLQSASAVSDSIRRQLTGEAKFTRAFLNFYATNLYGPVPIVTTTNYQVNNTIKRSPVSRVYQQIIADLEDAQSDLSDNFVNGTGVATIERTRPNKGAATALLARAFLYTGQWDSAIFESSAVINNVAQYALTGLDSVFLANSMEAVWQLEPVQPGYNTWDAVYFVLNSPPGTGNVLVSLSPFILNAFESGDKRYVHWVGSYTSDSVNYFYYPLKYKIWGYDPGQSVTEYTMVLRLAEQYLIRAEARANKGDISGAQADLNMIRSRAGLSPSSANDQTSLLAVVMHERQVELFTEWGHRWFDLIRTGNVNSIMGSPGNICQTKGGFWSPDWALMPIPLSETQINPNLTQNPGYN